jgi:hypothetical protein
MAPACSARRAIAVASTSSSTGSSSSWEAPTGPGRGDAAPWSQVASSSAYSTFSWAAWGSTSTTPSGDSAIIQVVPTCPTLRSGPSATIPPGGAVPPASASAGGVAVSTAGPPAGCDGHAPAPPRRYGWDPAESWRASAAIGRAPSPSIPSQCIAALCGRPCCCTAAQQARCTAANTLPSSRKRTSRLAGWTLTSTAAGSRPTVTTPKGWRPAGSRPR